jgi:hypothetical protein
MNESLQLFPKLPNIYLSWDIKSISELYGQSCLLLSKKCTYYELGSGMK